MMMVMSDTKSQKDAKKLGSEKVKVVPLGNGKRRLLTTSVFTEKKNEKERRLQDEFGRMSRLQDFIALPGVPRLSFRIKEIQMRDETRSLEN